MKFLTVEINSTGNEPVNPTEVVGLSFDAISSIEKLDSNRIYFWVDGFYEKTFQTKEEQDRYFDYIGNKLEAVDISPKINLPEQGEKA